MIDLRDRVADVIARAGDPEGAHSAEDALMREWIREHASLIDLIEFERMWDADFPRWCA